MSGGSMGYLYSKVEDADFEANTPLRILFKKHLNLVAAALHDIEWVDSSDYGEGDEEEAIIAAMNYIVTTDIVKAIREQQKVWDRLINKLEEKK